MTARPAGHPMPLASPPRRPDVVYGFGRIDASGRVADRATIAALGWRGGDRLTPTAEAGVMIARRDPGGMIVPARPYVVIPAPLRRRCGLRAGDHVLLACGCRKLCHVMRPASIRGSGRRAGPGAERACWSPLPANVRGQRAGSAVESGAGSGCCSGRRTHSGPAAGAVRSAGSVRTRPAWSSWLANSGSRCTACTPPGCSRGVRGAGYPGLPPGEGLSGLHGAGGRRSLPVLARARAAGSAPAGRRPARGTVAPSRGPGARAGNRWDLGPDPGDGLSCRGMVTRGSESRPWPRIKASAPMMGGWIERSDLVKRESGSLQEGRLLRR